MRAASAVAILFAAAAAHAQGNIDAERFYVPATSNGFLSVDGAFTAPHLGFSAGVGTTWAHDPVVLRSRNGAIISGGKIISSQFDIDFVGSFALWERLELGVNLPLAAAQATDDSVAKVPSLAGTALGDLRLDLKGVLWSPEAHGHRFALSFIAGMTAPTGNAHSFVSEGSVTGRLRLVGEWRARWARVALELGTVLQPARDFYDLHVATQLSYGVGVGVPLPRGFSLVGDIDGLIGVAQAPGKSLTSAEAPAEVHVAVEWRARFGLAILLGGGVGLSRGYGVPDGRTMFLIRYTTPERARREIVSSPVVSDRDHDGVVDGADRCPDAAGPRANDGCPLTVEEQQVDSDGDGTPDRADACPNVAGPTGNGGCPLPDADNDGVPDADDRCPQKAGPKENQGCPDFDSDGDGYVDRLDKCPFDPETFNGVDDDDGCPDQPAALVILGGDRITITEPILFERDGSVVDKRSSKLLGIIAHVLQLHPEILKLRIEGHTDNKGSALDLLELSAARAASVRRWLIDKGGIDGKRLVAEGFGRDKPIADNRDFVGRAKNRRIDFVVVQRLDAAP
jgi:outer membrane protein OmpA-like peptidoglycan-associated protein